MTDEFIKARDKYLASIWAIGLDDTLSLEMADWAYEYMKEKSDKLAEALERQLRRMINEESHGPCTNIKLAIEELEQTLKEYRGEK